MDDLYAQDPRIDTLRKPGDTSFDRQSAAADKKVWADLANRQHPIWSHHVADKAQLTPLKVEWMLHLIYQGGITTGKDTERNAFLSKDHEQRYRMELGNLHIDTGAGARVQAQRKVVRC